MEQAFDDYRNGVRPSGPGARDLMAFFESVDGAQARTPAGAPAVATDQTVRGLLARRAKTLHIGAANYCWFTDPSKALCLKLAGRTDSAKPLAGLCDSARCPQATHHLAHRPVWAQQAQATKVFIGGLSRRQDLERQRLTGELDRIERVIAEIDVATSTTGEQQ